MRHVSELSSTYKTPPASLTAGLGPLADSSRRGPGASLVTEADAYDRAESQTRGGKAPSEPALHPAAALRSNLELAACFSTRKPFRSWSTATISSTGQTSRRLSSPVAPHPLHPGHHHHHPLQPTHHLLVCLCSSGHVDSSTDPSPRASWPAIPSELLPHFPPFQGSPWRGGLMVWWAAESQKSDHHHHRR